MIDLKAARADAERWRSQLARKGAAEDFDALLAADERWRALVPEIDELRTQTKLKGKPTPEQLEALRPVKVALKTAEEELAAAESRETRRWRSSRTRRTIPRPTATRKTTPRSSGAWASRLHSPTHASTPRSAASTWSERRASPERASATVMGDATRVAMALYQFALDHLTEAGFTPVIPPVLVREEAMYGTGFFPTDRSNIYALEADGLFLTGTSEVALAALHMGEILETLPLRYTGFSTCFRREAGAAGRDTRGMFRVHQFNKVEMFVFVEPDTSWDEHERLLALEEQFLGALDLPYRVMNVAAGDLGASAAKKYDIEAWFPFQERYREVTSCSNTTDYQSRRLGIRYRSESGLENPHTLNGTMVTDRALLAILENLQGGVPDVLTRYGAPTEVRVS